MQTPTASELLTVWERARTQPVTTQALMLLEAASPDVHREELAKLSVGRRDARLLALREGLFGSRLTALTACPHCGQQFELSIEAAEIRLETDQVAPEVLTVRSENYVAHLRLPNSEDLAAIAECIDEPSEAAAIRALLSRCLVELRRNGRKQKLERLESMPQGLIDIVAAEMERADPQANVQLNLQCADCGHRWSSPFDIVTFLWIEIDHWARQILSEVCTLASAFGWREADILAMSAYRRQLYLQILAESN